MTNSKYYHVRLTTKSAPDAPEFEFDLSFEDIEKRFMGPYDMGEAIVVNGKTVPIDNLEQLQIGTSNLHSDRLNSEFLAKARAARNVFPVNPRGRVNSQIIFERTNNDTSQFIVRPPGSERKEHSQPAVALTPSADPRAVFVVQGRNGEANSALDAYLRAIDLRPIEWPHATSATATGTPHNNQAVDAGFSRAHAVVVLFTPDDVVKLRRQFWEDNEPEYEKRPNGQARPNVIYETGRAMERFPTRTVIVELGDLRPFSDIAGLNTIRMNDTPERRQDLADRLKAIGCGVKVDSRTIYSAGNFDAAIAEEPSEFPESSDDASYPATNTELPDSAEELLLEAVKDASASIWALSTMGGLIIATNNREFIEEGNARSEARWKKALSDLEEARLIEEATPKRESFKVTDRGFALADSLDESIKES